ncbi:MULTISPECIES: hypothetical protein [unclassified Paenibacillus]|uniref:hypothetical protein n=1 Tax=unclassified Paenibacillus TaxID=185978 RepID=UPI00034E000D|nr:MULTISPECIES: hypothetical protein [unclassified Paenibacillus]EPD81341.1 hypothetical protein HMPREF1207_05099 [Paenibacillus sp. HGH0039]
MKLKSLTIGSLVGVSLLFGAVSASAAPVSSAASVAPYANQNLVINVGQYHQFNGTVFVVENPFVIGVTLPSLIQGLQPGHAVIDVYSNGQYTRYDVFVKTI